MSNNHLNNERDSTMLHSTFPPGVDTDQEWLHMLREHAPMLFDCVDLERLEEGRRVVQRISAITSDFDSMTRGGRGESYRRAQTSTFVRTRGILGLFNLLSPHRDFRNLPCDSKILDVLGGDGLLARVMSQIAGERFSNCILTGDLSEDMIHAAEAYGLVAICQAAQHLILRDGCVDGVILAYGTHHIPRQDRLRVCQEAHRVLRVDGKVLLHDFEDASPVARWFSEVVDRFSRTGHAFQHFTITEMREYLLSSGFTDVYVEYLYDPFILTADSEARARRALAGYLIDMYGLEFPLQDSNYERALHQAYKLADEYFRYDYNALGLDPDFGASRIRLYKINGRVHIELPRVAIVGIGTRKSRPSVTPAPANVRNPLRGGLVQTLPQNGEIRAVFTSCGNVNPQLGQCNRLDDVLDTVEPTGHPWS